MILQWVGYALAVSALTGVAAWLAERGARDQGWPGRGVWLGALAVSTGLPLWAWLGPSPETPALSLMAVPTTLVLESIPSVSAVGGDGGAGGVDAAALAVGVWVVLTVLLLAGIAGLLVRLHRRRRAWSRSRLEGVDVWVSRRTGPAALGVLRGHVVVPEWALSLAPEKRRLLVLHEAEHVRARDPQLALTGLILCALVPWNLPLWWQLARLRLAIEVDCDDRVLRRAGDARGYGSLLLEVCQRKAHLVLALAESRSMLERRIRMIAKTTTGPATLRAIVLAAVAGLVLGVACETPGPTDEADAGLMQAYEAQQHYVSGEDTLTLREFSEGMSTAACEPTWFVNGSRSSSGTVDDLKPESIESINVFKGVGIPAPESVQVCGLIAILTESANVDEEAAHRRIVEDLSAVRRAEAGQGPSEVLTLEEVQEEPTFTPMTVRPRLRNAGIVRAALERAYPSSLREAGTAGTTNVWFLIDAEGSVKRVLVNEGSGYQAIDDAALEVAGTMEFTPAYNRDQPVPVWIALDITFQPTQ